MHIVGHHAADWTCIESIGETARAPEFVPTDLSWDHFFELLCQPIESFSSTFCCPSRSILIGPTSQRRHRTGQKDTWDHLLSMGRVSAIVDPLHMYLRRPTSTSTTARGKSREWCTSGDLFFFYYLLYKRLCAPAHGLVQYFSSAHHRQDHRQ
ncbi:hypothetical protein Hanom_Chr10g00913751 [Helianthus anomalus]